MGPFRERCAGCVSDVSMPDCRRLREIAAALARGSVLRTLDRLDGWFPLSDMV